MKARTSFWISVIGLTVLTGGAIFAQERSAGSSQEVQASWAALKTMVASANAKSDAVDKRVDGVEKMVDNIIACGKQSKIWDESAKGCTEGKATVADGDFITQVVGGGKRGAAGCGHYPTDKTVDKLCHEAGFTGATGVATGEYGDPGGECVYTWEGDHWEKWGSLTSQNKNLYIDKLICYKFKN